MWRDQTVRAASVRGSPAVDEIGQGERHVARLRGEAVFAAAVMTSARVEAAASREPRSRSVASWRSPMTRSVTSATTQSMPALAPASSASGE